MHSTTIAVDLAKSVFEVALSQRPGKVSARRRLSRGQFSRFLAEQAPATVVMEACGTAHFWGREARARGHRVVLIPPHAVRPYVLRNKTDGADAKGLLEALRNEAIRPVPVKSIDQHVLASLHRLRSAWMATRTARLNTLRGLLRELGFAIPVGARQVVPRVGVLVADADSGLPEALRPVLAEAIREVRELEARMRELERSLETLARESELVGRLRTIPGVGLLTATALVAFVGDVSRFPSARHFASYLGLTPRGRPAACAGAWEPSASAGTPTCGCCSSTAPAPCSCTRRSPPPNWIACAPGRWVAKGPAATTRQPWPSPTSWPGSSGPSGATNAPTTQPPKPRRSDPPTRPLRAHDGDDAPVLTGPGKSR
jgi:transposase